MSATAPARVHSADRDFDIALISSRETESLLRTIGCSRWSVKELTEVADARSEIERSEYPVVVCGITNWRGVLESARHSKRQPGVIVVAERANDFEWLQVLEAGCHYVPLDKLNPGTLFSLLNLLWRSWHEECSRG